MRRSIEIAMVFCAVIVSFALDASNVAERHCDVLFDDLALWQEFFAPNALAIYFQLSLLWLSILFLGTEARRG